MNRKQFTKMLGRIKLPQKYSGHLSGYAVQSIVKGRSSYPVSNLVEYCNGTGVRMTMTDMTTDEAYDIDKVENVHEVIGMLMNRYDIGVKRIFLETGVHYTPPNKQRSPLSIDTLLAVCSSLHCKIEITI